MVVSLEGCAAHSRVCEVKQREIKIEERTAWDRRRWKGYLSL